MDKKAQAVRTPLSRRRFVAFAMISLLLPILVIGGAALALDVYLHKRAERSAGLNIWGYRGPIVGAKRPDQVRLVMLGGSTVFGYGLLWSEAPPAALERVLNGRSREPRFSVINLGFNNEGAYAYRFALEDFEFLNYDIAVLYDGYNDLPGDSGPNLALYRHRSAVFRLVGYYPILPLYLNEKAMQIRSGGNLNAAYRSERGEEKTVFTPNLAQRTSAATLKAAANVADALGRQLGRLSDESKPALQDTDRAGCAYPWSHYCQSFYSAIAYALADGKRVAIVLQPLLDGPARPRQIEQQTALRDMIARHFGHDSRVLTVDLSTAVDLNDTDLAFDHLHLSREGTIRTVAVLADRIQPMLTALESATR